MFNGVLDVKEEYPLYGYTEPLTLADAKTYMVVDFPDYDTLITSLIVAAREQLESYLGLSLVEKNLTVQINNSCGQMELPYGPVTSEIDKTTITDYIGNVINPSIIDIRGNVNKTLYSPCFDWIQLIYTAGYNDSNPIPEAILTALKAQVFFLYQNRGEALSSSLNGVKAYEVLYVCDAAKQLCKRYRRVWDSIF
jgi:uncharacterized phiE125 gp8 family phage protein